VAETLRSWASPLREAKPQTPLRVVDVGCGLGYVTRWLAAHQVLGPGVELVGVDMNSVLAVTPRSWRAPKDWTAGS